MSESLEKRSFISRIYTGATAKIAFCQTDPTFSVESISCSQLRRVAQDRAMIPRNFFAELKRRNVYKVAVAYAVVAWLVIQAASIILPTFEAPPWVMKAFVGLLALGFILAAFISLAFGLTPDRIHPPTH